VSKRSRGSRRSPTHRPGTRAPLARGTRTARPASQLTTAAEIASDAIEQEPDEAIDEPTAAVPARSRPRGRTSSTLATRAATEYLYVAQDVRRIVVVAALLFGLMLLLWVLIVVARVIPI
jgi:hypothetical protein